MSTSGALYSSASLKAANAQPYSSMEGTLDPMLLLALKDMEFEFMTPVQSKVLGGLPSLQSDCLVQAKTGTCIPSHISFLLYHIENGDMSREQSLLDDALSLKKNFSERQ